MKDRSILAATEAGLTNNEIEGLLRETISAHQGKLEKVLLIPPDYTRLHSYGGRIAAILYRLLNGSCKVDLLPALGTHEPVSHEEAREMFGGEIPYESLIQHNWRTDVEKLGEIPACFVSQVSEGLVNEAIDVEVNKHLLDKSYDLIISIGQVVPHEVVGMANYSKNIFVGCGGNKMINRTHMLGAFYGMERIMGRDHSPVRKVFDYAEEHFIKDLPLMYILTVTTQSKGNVSVHGVFTGRSRKVFEEAVGLAQKKNLTYVEKPLKKVVVFLNEKEFKSTWLGNKAIYRTRMAIADGGELIVLAPGVKKFGEDDRNNALIRDYGYLGREKILELVKTDSKLGSNLSVAAHLIHGSSDGRFNITYAVEKLAKDEVEKANFRYMALKDAYRLYNPAVLKDGFNILESGEEIFYISNPALGLWVDKARF